MPAVSKKQQKFFRSLLSNPEERKEKGISKKDATDFAQDVKEGKIADALKKTIADMKAADRKAGLLPGGKDVVDLDVERQRRRKKKVEEALERQAKDRKKLSQPHSVSGSRRDHSHDVDSALTDHVPRKGKGRVRPASKKEMRVSAMRDAGIKEEKECPAGQYYCFDMGKCRPIPQGKKVRADGELVSEVAPPGWGHTKAEKEKTKPWKPKSKIGGSAAAFKKDLESGKFKGLPGSKTKKEKTADMFKIMWAAKKKGYKPHYKPGTDKKYKKYQKESTMPNVDPKDRKVIKDRAKTLFTKDLKGTVRGVNEDSENFASRYAGALSSLDRHRGPEAKKDLAKKIGKRRKDEAELRRLLQHYKDVKRGVAEGKTWKDFQTAIDRVRGKKTEMPKPKKADDAGARARRRVQRREYQNKVSVIVPPELED